MLIGSRALAYWVSEFKCRPNADWDFIGEQTVEVPEGATVEIHSLDLLNNKDALIFDTNGVCSLYGLTLIKRSHLHRDLHFDRHIAMYHKWLLPNTDVTHESPFLKERIAATKKEFPQGNPRLSQTNEDFFDDAVEKVYDHDWLHTLYAHEEKPMYEKLKKPDRMDQAWCEKDLWNELTDLQKRQCVAEECYVIATERFLVPKQFDFPPKLAYLNALRKVCTTLTSGWFRDYAIDHYPQIIDLFNLNKINQVKEQLK